MKWTFIIQQKFKIALLLFCIMLLIVVTNLISRKNVGDISRSFQSLYDDRLIPATDIFYLSENLFNKRLLLENYLMSEDNIGLSYLKSQIQRHNRVVDSLIVEFEKTYLVGDESKFLEDFKEKSHKYAGLEKTIFQLVENSSREEALTIFQEQGRDVFYCTIENLEKLTQIQSNVGKNLNVESQLDVASLTTLSSIQLILVFVIGAIVHALVFASKTLRVKQKQNYHLN